jgi:hypothetical protein
MDGTDFNSNLRDRRMVGHAFSSANPLKELGMFTVAASLCSNISLGAAVIALHSCGDSGRLDSPAYAADLTALRQTLACEYADTPPCCLTPHHLTCLASSAAN